MMGRRLTFVLAPSGQVMYLADLVFRVSERLEILAMTTAVREGEPELEGRCPTQLDSPPASTCKVRCLAHLGR